MNFQQAKDKLKKLASGEYHVLNYKISEFSDGELQQECTVYVNGRNHHYGKTWEAALKSLKNEIHPPSKKPAIIDNIEEIKKEV